MKKDNQPDQSRVIKEMFDIANISQPVPFRGVPGGITPDNIQIPQPHPQITTANNGFTADNLQPSIVTPETDPEIEE